eukprot:6177490-Pleurochrysis_carterae.AAC.1
MSPFAAFALTMPPGALCRQVSFTIATAVMALQAHGRHDQNAAIEPLVDKATTTLASVVTWRRTQAKAIMGLASRRAGCKPSARP